MGIEKLIHPLGDFEIQEGGIVSGDLAYGVQVRLRLTSADTIAALDAVYVDSAGLIQRAQGNASSTMPAIGVCPNAVSSGAIGTVVVGGLVTGYNFSGSVGRAQYVSAGTAGQVNRAHGASSGQLIQVIGYAYNVSTLLVSAGEALQQSGAAY